MVGSVVGDYRITDKLGEGGFGVVYKAVHRLSEQEVAIKTIDSVLTTDPKFRDRFFTEARIQAKLKHPNIVVMHNFFEHEDRYYIVLEYMEGVVLPDGRRARTLAELIRQGPIPEDRLVVLFRQILDAVGYAHHHGVLHRDIKPLNMLFAESGAVKVADFGIAKMVGGETSVSLSGARVGTPAYMSPEQVFDKKLTRSTDIYSLGCTLYEMATGTLPFKESDTSSLLEAHVSEPPRPPRQVNPAVSEQLAQVILKAMAKKPDDRYNNCHDFAGELAPTGKSRKVIVPHFRGLPVADAEALARQVGVLVVRRADEYSADVPLGAVLRQDPEFGSVIEQDSAVALHVSRGRQPEAAIVPHVAAKPGREAEEVIGDDGTKLSEKRAGSSDQVTSGAILRHSPAAGVVVEAGDTADGVSSKGRRQSAAAAEAHYGSPARAGARWVRVVLLVCGLVGALALGWLLPRKPAAGSGVAHLMPDLRGVPLSQAQDSICRLGLVPGRVARVCTDDIPDGAVVFTTPSAGAQVEPGQTIDLTSSKGDEPEIGHLRQQVYVTELKVVELQNSIAALTSVRDSLASIIADLLASRRPAAEPTKKGGTPSSGKPPSTGR